MPRWRTKVEHVGGYLLGEHNPRAGLYEHIGDGSVADQVAQHQARVARVAAERSTNPRRLGTMAVHLDTNTRVLEFVLRRQLFRRVSNLLLFAGSAVIGVIALLTVLVADGPTRTVAFLFAIACGAVIALVNNAPDRVPMLFSPRLPDIGEEATLLDEK